MLGSSGVAAQLATSQEGLSLMSEWTEELCFLCHLCRDVTSRTVSESQFVKSYCSWGTGTVREPRERGTSAVGSRYQATTGENTSAENT
jgi:hypothetical protein